MDASCSNCRFFKGYEENEPTGECHRRAPSVSPDALAPGRIWPLVGRLNWCGEHEPPIAAVTEVRILDPAPFNELLREFASRLEIVPALPGGHRIVIRNVGPTNLVFSSQASVEENRVDCETGEAQG